MKLLRSAHVLAGLFVLSITPAIARAQQGPPPAPKPGPEHEILKMDAGTWDAVVEFVPGPGAPLEKSKGVEVNTIGCGGLCLISDFKGEAMGSPFHGHGITTWDAVKKKYVGSWTDSMSQGLLIGEMAYDAAKKQATGWMEGPDMSGKVMRTRSVLAYTADGRVLTAFAPGPDGKEMQVMKITYTKRK